MRAIRVLGLSVGLVVALVPARDAVAGPATSTSTSTTSTTSSTASTTTTVTSSTTSSTLATTTTTTTNTTTTSQFPPPCIGDVEVDPEDTVASLTAGVLSAMPIRVTITSGLMNLQVNDGGAGGSFSGLCFGIPIGIGAGQTTTLACNYTPSASPPAQITITANLTPHSGGGTACGTGSASDSDSKTFPVGATTTTTTTSSTTSTTTTTSSSTTTTLPTTTTTTSTTTSTTSTTTREGRVAVCHKGRNTLVVGAPALEAHLGHGDSEGPCPSD